MDKISLLLVSVVVAAYTTIYAQDSCPPRNISMHPDTIPGSNWTYPTLFNWNFENVGDPGINSGSVGAMYFQDKFYFNKWNVPFIYRYDGGWEGPNSFLDSITYVGSVRDLATDGQYLYGGTATNTVNIFDADGISIGSLILSDPAVARAIAFTPDENGFYVCTYNDNIILCDAVTGAIIRVLPGTNALKLKYGLAYSNIKEEGPVLWVWGQGTTLDPYNNLWKVNPATGDTIAKYRFGPLTMQTGSESLIGIAGGAEVCVINNSSVLLLNYQNYALTGYVLGDAPVGIKKDDKPSTSYKLMQNYPNPFNPSTTITFNLASNSKVSIRVFNLLGQEVAELVKGELSAGVHLVKFDGSKLPSGIYIYKLETSGRNGKECIAARKMILLK